MCTDWFEINPTVSEVISLTMAYKEIDSFVLKFKNLLFAGNDADLRIKNTNDTSKRIILRDQLGPKSGNYLYTLELKINKGKIKKASFSWPLLSSSQKSVFQNLKRIL